MLTSKELRYKLLIFTIFIIQSQVGAIPVFRSDEDDLPISAFSRLKQMLLLLQMAIIAICQYKVKLRKLSFFSALCASWLPFTSFNLTGALSLIIHD